MKVENSRSDASSLYQRLALNPNTLGRFPADTEDQRPLQFIKQQESHSENWMDGVTEGEVDFLRKMFQPHPLFCSVFLFQ